MPATAVEQMILELINRARLDPAAEAARDGIDLNEGLAPGTIPATSVQPLAMNETLLTVARAHNQDEITYNYFAHNDHAGLTPFQRMTNAGYTYTWAGENIAWNGTTPGAATTQMQLDNETNLFVDTFQAGRGHRLNLLNPNFQEVGVGSTTATGYQGYNSALVTQDFGSTGSGPILTGVSYNDTDFNKFYSIGEGRNGVTVSVAGGGSTATAGAGGYALAIAAGQQTVTFSGGGLAASVGVKATIAANTNAKIDMVDQNTVTTSVSLTDLGGATRIIGLGTIGLTLTGNSSSETFSGTKGNDAIIGGGGVDSVVFSGARSAYTVSNSGGNLIVSGPEGTDTLTGISRLIFTDQTVNLVRRPAADFNGDAKSDILWRNSNGAVGLWDSSPSGAYSYVGVGSLDSTWQISGVGDFNDDGKSDVLLRNSNGTIGLWDSSPSGAFSYLGVGSLDSSWQIAGIGDFNGDGKADMLLRNTNGAIGLWDSSTSGGYSYVGVGSLDGSWQISGVGDFNGDGKSDMLLRNSSGAIGIWDSTPSGSYSYVGVSVLDSSWQIADVGDFNNDGKSDILWRNSNGAVGLWNSTPSGGYSYVGVSILDSSWQVAGVGDFGGDGAADVLWRNANGDTNIWTSNGSGGFAGTDLGIVATSWSIPRYS